MAIVYFDYNAFSYSAYYKGVSSTAYRRTYSILAGAKASMIIPNNAVSPYFMGALGMSSVTSPGDTAYTSDKRGDPIRIKARSGITPSFLAAVGADIVIYGDFSVFLEIRASSGIDHRNIYDLLVLGRAGIGLAID